MHPYLPRCREFVWWRSAPTNRDSLNQITQYGCPLCLGSTIGVAANEEKGDTHTSREKGDTHTSRSRTRDLTRHCQDLGKVSKTGGAPSTL